MWDPREKKYKRTSYHRGIPRGIIRQTSLLFGVFNRFLKRGDSPKGFALSAEVQGCEAAVVPVMKRPPSSLQQSPANLRAAPLCCNVKGRRPLVVGCLHRTPLTRDGLYFCIIGRNTTEISGHCCGLEAISSKG